MSEKVRYVLVVPVTPAGCTAVGITKKKGPAFLLNKVTFPGGRIEAGEAPAVAAARELAEEVGVVVDATQMVLVDEVHHDGKALYCFAVVTPKARHARQLETEPVWLLDVPFHLEQARKQPDAYAPDFLANLDRALAVARLSLKAAA